MATEIKMPQLSDTMYSGKILAWHKQVGDEIKRGDILAEVETDKANLEIESFFGGTLLSVMIKAGDIAKVGEVIAVIGQAGEKVGETVAEARPASAGVMPGAASPVTLQAGTVQAGTVQADTVQAEQEANHETNQQSPARQPITVHVTPASSSESHGRIKASPLAKRIAAERNIDLSSIHGSGPEGRIVRKDLESGNGQPSQAGLAQGGQYSETPENTSHFARSPVAAGSGALRPFSKMRETIAKRMQQSVTEAPHFFTATSINMKEAIRLRGKLKVKEEFKGISVNHLVIKAAAYALQNEPRVNFAVRDGQIYEPAQINIGIITALEDGLLIPVIKETNTLPLRDLVFEARAAVERARAGRPSSSDLTGGTFSISNMGMYDVDSFTAIINPGQGAVLAVSSTKDRVIVADGQTQIAPMMSVTLSVDHRIIDGIMSANFLKYFKEALEMPALLM